MSQDMMGLTLDIAVKTLFGTTLPGEAEQVGRAMTFLMRYSLRRQRMPVRIPETWPTPNNRRANQELAFMDSLVYRIISERQSSNGGAAHHNDLLALLMDAMDEDGSHMTPQQLRDETMTLFIAGHETTSQMLSWTWYALSQNPAIEERLYEELHGVLGGRPPEVADLQRLPYLQAVMNESLRLYPPAYVLARDGDRAVPDRRLRYSARRDDFARAVGDASRSALLRRPGNVSPGTLARRIGAAAARGRVFSVWRRPAAVHRAGIRADGSGDRDRSDGAEIPAAAGAGARGGAGAARHAAAPARHSYDAACAELRLPQPKMPRLRPRRYI